MSINKYGFLGKNIKQYESKLETQYKDVFNFCEEFNHFLHKAKFDIKLNNDDFQGGTIIGRRRGSGLEMTHFPLILACC